MRALKISLWIAGIGCLLSLFGMVLPVSSWESIAKLFGVESVPNLPQFSYAIILALDPLKYGVMVPFSGFGAVFVGMVCAIAGLLTKIAFWWFMGDSLSCLILGALILVFWQQAKKTAG